MLDRWFGKVVKKGDDQECSEGFEEYIETLGVLGPEALSEPERWLVPNEGDTLSNCQDVLGRVPLLAFHWA